MILTQPDQGLQLPQPWIQRRQSAQPVPVGAQGVRQLVAVTRIGLGTGSAPARPGSMKGGGMHRDHGMAGGHQPVHHQPGRPFNDHRHLGRLAMAGTSRQRLGKRLLGVPQRPALQDPAWSSSTVTSWLVLAHSHPTNFTLASSEEPIVDSTVSRPAAGVSLFGPRSGMSLTPVTGPRRASGAAELKLAVVRHGNEAVP